MILEVKQKHAAVGARRKRKAELRGKNRIRLTFLSFDAGRGRLLASRLFPDDWANMLIDTSNAFLVRAMPSPVVEAERLIVFTTRGGLNILLDRQEAMNLSAWLRALADPAGMESEKVYQAVLNT